MAEGFPPVEVGRDELRPRVPSRDARPRDYMASCQHQAITDQDAGTGSTTARLPSATILSQPRVF
jgi:hypothetical protein